MMSRHDWAMLGVIGLSAFASGTLTYSACQRITNLRSFGIQSPTVVEFGVEVDSEGGLFFTPLKPSLGDRMVGPERRLAYPPLRLKTGEGAMLRFRGRREPASLFKGTVPFKLKPGESRIYMYVPLGETVRLEAGSRFRHPG